MNKLTKIILWFLLIVAAESFALYCVKKWSTRSNQHTLIVLAILGYAAVVLALGQILLLGEGVAMVNIIWNIMSSLYGVIIGLVLFDEKLSYLQYIGLGLGVVAIVLIFSSQLGGGGGKGPSP